jgi:hypothetical protein
MTTPSRARANTALPTNYTPKKSKRAKQRVFLDAFAEHANVLMAARDADVTRRLVYYWLEHDEDFSFAFNQAKEDAKDVLRAEIYRRAVEGWDEPVTSAGKLVGTVRKYSDVLLIFHSKALMPEYREKHQVEMSGPGGTPVQVQHTHDFSRLSDDQYEQYMRLDAIARGG